MPANKASGISFANKENDYPVSQKPPYGVAGWTKDDHSAIVYDAYDLWELFPDGVTKPRRLTDGGAEEVRHRYVRMSAARQGGRGGRGGGEETEWIDLEKPVYLSLEGRWTKRTGYALLQNGKVDRLVWLDKGVRGPEKAKNADVYVYQAGAWDDSPNDFAAGADLKNARRVSDTNPFASQFAWGRAELIDYKNSHGDRLQGALYYPANYEKANSIRCSYRFTKLKATSCTTGPRHRNGPLTIRRRGRRTATLFTGRILRFARATRESRRLTV